MNKRWYILLFSNFYNTFERLSLLGTRTEKLFFFLGCHNFTIYNTRTVQRSLALVDKHNEFINHPFIVRRY